MKLQTNFFDILKRVESKNDFPKELVTSIGETMMKTLHDEMAHLNSGYIRVYRFGTFEIRKNRFIRKYEKIWNDVIKYKGKKIRTKYLIKGELNKWMDIKNDIIKNEHKKLDIQKNKNSSVKPSKD